MLRTAFLAGCLLAASLAVAPIAKADAPAESSRNTLAAQLEELADAYRDVYGFSGTVKVVQGDAPLLEASFGAADRESGRPHEPATPTSINSISKTFTAVAVLRLAERGEIDLHAPIADYLPGLTAPWRRSVTAHHLLSHTSGLPREAGLDAADERSLQELVAVVDALAPAFEPGARYGYSNAGYILLGRLLERVTGNDYSEVIRAEIVEPLGLEHTGVYRGLDAVLGQAVPYRMTPDGVEIAQRTKTLGESAGGGLYSTPGDLYRFVSALENDTLLGAAMRDAMFAAHTETGDGHEGYAWSVKAFGPNPIRFAAGSGYGTKSVVVRDPASGDFIGIVSNWGNTPILDLLRDLFLALNGQRVQPPSADRLADPADYREALGRYAFDEQALRTALQAEDGTIRLHAVDGRLFMDDELMARGPDGTLTLTYTDELVIGVADGTMTLELGGQRLEGRRID